MIHDLEEVKRMFVDADKIIQSRPELLSMSIDEIFEELNDGTQEMIHNRWGVMTRVKMQELQCIDNEKIINFLLGVKERNLLCEYIGFILQYEYGVSLLALLLNSYEKGVHNEIIPFVEHCIEYEKNCFVERLDDILGILNSLTKENKKSQFIYSYAELVVEKGKEESVFNKFLNNSTETLGQLVYQIGGVLFHERSEMAEKWLEIFLENDSKTYRNMGISFIERSLYSGVSAFEKHFCFLEKISLDMEFWKQIIPLYTCYISMNCEKKYDDDVEEHLKKLKESSVDEKRICIQSLEFKVKKSEKCKEIMDTILETSFEKDNQILGGIDFYFEELFLRDSMNAIKKIYKIYEVNKFGNNDHFIDTLPRTMKEMKKHQSQLVNNWWDCFLHGNDEAFFLSIEIFSKVLSIECISGMIKEIIPSQEQLLCFLDGICLFTIDENKIADTCFSIAPYVSDEKNYVGYCIEHIFCNYSGAMINAANKNAESENSQKRFLAEEIRKYFNSCEEKMKKGYEERDFVPPLERRLLYKKTVLEQNRKINEKAEKQSIFAELFPTRRMKYGSRFGFVQKQTKGELHYSVSDYMRNTISMELPRRFINDPIGYVFMRMDYLRRRNK